MEAHFSPFQIKLTNNITALTTIESKQSSRMVGNQPKRSVL